MSKYDLLQDQRQSLPTFEFKQDLIDAIREYNILVVIGETGTSVLFNGFSFC
jgi:HrpA-like RNA helicase